jgi:hypothetical protein
MHRPSRCLLVAVPLLLTAAAPAGALPLVGDETIVLLTSKPALDSAGIVVGALPGATLGLDVAGRTEVLFPITGGDLGGAGGTIEHGGGLLLSDGAINVTLEDFVIDLAALQLSGDVAVDGLPAGSVALFDVADCFALAGTPGRCLDGDGSTLLTGLKLSLTAPAATLLSDAFGGVFSVGSQVGVARIDARVVPEPTAALLLACGVAGISTVSRRAGRAARQAPATARSRSAGGASH